MKKRRFGQIFRYFRFHDGSWKKLARCLYLAENMYITPSGVVMHIVDPSIYLFVPSRILREMSIYIFIFHVIIFFTRTSGLAEADGSWRKLTEVLKIDKNIENSMRNSLKILKNNLNL